MPFRCGRKALEGNAAYVALIASRHRSKLVLDYPAAEGAPAQSIASVWVAAGLDLGAATPEEIALSFMSQMVETRRGGSVTPLSLKRSGLEAQTADPEKVIQVCETERPG